VISRPIFILWSKPSRGRSLPALLGLLLLPACDGIQSVLDPRGPDAQQIAVMSWIMFAEGALIFLIVMALAAYALFASPNRRAKIGRRDLIIGGGILFPVVMLSALLIYSLTVADAIVGTVEPVALRIEVVGEQWWWRVHYLDSAGKPQVATANEIHIPVGRPVELSLKTADVIHSFWVPSLAGKVDMIPGHINTLRLKAKQPGVFRGQCAEYCGGPHALMAFYLVAQTPEEFNAWLASERQWSRAPRSCSVAKRYFCQRSAVRMIAALTAIRSGAPGPRAKRVPISPTWAAAARSQPASSQIMLARWPAGSQTASTSSRKTACRLLASTQVRNCGLSQPT
jgi:cytochrome c oxidase subunit 2